jgi:uncharacterized protein
VGPTTPLALLERVFDRIRGEQPDVLLLGGDYVYLDATPDRLLVLRQLVESVSSAITLAVLGNHDLWTWDGAIADALSSAGASVLVNQAVALPTPWSDVVVIGLCLTAACAGSILQASAGSVTAWSSSRGASAPSSCRCVRSPSPRC